MKSYLEIQVPLRYDAPWQEELRDVLRHVNVRWQKGYYHITVAFLDETPLDKNLCPILERHLNQLNAPTLTFDKLDVFSTRSATHIIYLTASDVPHDFLSAIDSIRTELKAAGSRMDSNFRLHVTLGRVVDPRIKLQTLRELVGKVPLPSLPLTLCDVDYREFRGRTFYETRLKF